VRLSLTLLVTLLAISASDKSCDAFSGHPSPSILTRVSRGGSGVQSTATSMETGNDEKKSAIVVGGGPVGLATAMTLASEPHCYNVKIMEATTGDAAAATYDATKAYLYNVNLRGQRWTRTFPEVQAKLHERGVPVGPTAPSGIMIVPSDPSTELPPFKATGVGGAPKPGEKPLVEEDGKNTYWIPRHAMVQLLLEEAQATEGIEFCGGQACEAVLPSVDENKMLVTTRDTVSGESNQFEADLVVGADGMNSKVREYLATDPTHALQDEFQDYNPKKFRVKKWTSPSSHLRIKVLQFPPQFEIPDVNETTHVSASDNIYAIRSIYNAPKTYLSLGLLPMKDNTQVRPTNIVTRPNHVIWTMTDGPSVRKWFETAFPRMPFKDSSMISDEEWDRFAKAEGTRFPSCQYSCGMQISHNGKGVVLVGDAMHAYPPDIGQGVNSGLLDVVALDRALRGVDIVTGQEPNDTSSSSHPDLSTALRTYEKNRIPEVKALIRYARFGAPYQYRQSHRIDRFRQKLWTANLVLRLLLNKITIGLVPQAAIMLANNEKLVSFRQIMRRADLTTIGLTMATVTLMIRCFFWNFVTTLIRPTP